MTDRELVPPATRGPGRPPGSPNRNSKAVKDMLLEALDELGGKNYLIKQALIDNPSSFMTLLGKIIPTQIANADGETFKTEQSLPEQDKAILEHYIKTKAEK